MRKIIAALVGGTLIGFATLFAPSVQAAPKPDDCNRVAKTDRALCRAVKAQVAYAFAVNSGINYTANGRALVHEITHQGLTKGEMHSYLAGEALTYRQHVTGTRSVAVDMNSLRTYHGTDAQWIVGFEDADGRPGGAKEDRVEIDLP